MRIQDIQPADGSRKKVKRVGRGQGSGHGKTATKGHKGQKARTGGGTKPGFEGGQMPLHRRLPKRGFTNIFAKEYAIINLEKISELGLDTITPEILVEEGVIKNLKNGLKVLGVGELKKAVNVKANAFSESAKKKIADSGGQAEVI